MDTVNIKIYEKGDPENGDKFMYHAWYAHNMYVVMYNGKFMQFDGDKFALFVKTNKFILEYY